MLTDLIKEAQEEEIETEDDRTYYVCPGFHKIVLPPKEKEALAEIKQKQEEYLNQ